MRVKSKKIQAFTLVEITIVLLLSLLLIGIVMLGYRHFEQYRTNQKNRSDELSEVLLLHTRLKSSFERADRIEVNRNEMELVFIDTMIFASCMIHDNGMVFHQNSLVDSIHMDLKDIQINQIMGKNLLRNLSFEPKNNLAKRRFQYQKEYGRKVLFNSKDVENEY